MISPYRPFDSVLVANRGEIACRILRTAQALGLRTVAVFSEADAEAPHVALADVAVCVGPAPVAASYLRGEALIDAARRAGAEAVHPGYGFLSENADFARAVVEAGLVWIGPPPEAIEAMGAKGPAKARMRAAGVPCVPGFEGAGYDLDVLAAQALEVGFPLMIKASAGGGGRGMRRLEGPQGLSDALRSAKAEAEGAFGDGALILERAVDGARHVEIQIFADAHGDAIHLFERDCSVQRRHQKVIEEAPSPAVGPELRAKMGAAAVAAAEAIGYVGAGTVECLLAPSGDFYFLEMNTRLQVEHPVTEAITGLDLVALQLAVAAGDPLPLRQADVTLSGHAIEARLYAEDPAADFAPRTGRIARWRPPEAARVDAGVQAGGEITPHYDPMIAKIITHGPTRAVARRRMLRALEATTLHGVVTNQRLLHQIVAHPVFAAGEADTGFIPTHLPASARALPPAPAEIEALAVARLYGGDGAWSSAAPRWCPAPLEVDGEIRSHRLMRLSGPARCAVLLHGAAAPVEIRVEAEAGDLRYGVGGLWRRARFTEIGGALHLSADATTWIFSRPQRGAAEDEAGEGQITAPMAGAIVEIRAEAGQRVARGDLLVIQEAMKMQHELLSPVDGVVAGVHAAPGDQVEARQILITFTPEPTS